MFAQGSYVFIPDEEECFLAAKVESNFSPGSAGAVKLVESGRRVRLSAGETSAIISMNEQSLDPLDDMVHLKQLDEASILYNLRMRFLCDNIYTNIGSILVSINPFKVLPIYSPEVVDDYIKQGSRNMPPHIFGVADNAYRAMTSFGRSQSCIVSGESGAGKTEATKLFLQYLSEKSSSGSSKSAVLQEQILEANPLLEAFGNAKTVRNDNSSRFGKLIEVYFDKQKGSIVGGSITSYLLEKSRLVQQSARERNYHIFYQLCAAASMDPELHAKFDLQEADQYYFLNQSDSEDDINVPGVNDYNEWNNTVSAMEVMGISTEECQEIIRILAGILHLGNIQFSGTEEKSSVENSEMLELAADQLGTSPTVLEKALCMRNRGNAKESVYANQGVNEAKDSRDALSKAIYSYLFDWLIDEKINKCLAKSLGSTGVEKCTIGVLDIFGFESFEHNSFEQLCINYCNEKLQGHFVEHIFKLEQEEYRREGVDVSMIAFEDTSGILTVLEKKGAGVFPILDEENRLPRGNDEGFLSKVLAQTDSSNGILRKPDIKKQRSNSGGARFLFTVVHYAGEVSYDSRGFLEKNKDMLLADLAALGANSSFKFLASLFRAQSKGDGKRGGDSNKKTIHMQFRDQLATLMDTLNSTDPHYVRCIKPNSQKVGNQFTAPMCLDQLRYAGLLDVCKIRKIGYPVRKEFKEFLYRYRPLASGSGSVSSEKDLCNVLTKMGLLASGQWQIGKNKIFLRQEQFDDLESARELALSKQMTLVQKVARGFIAKRRYKSIKKFLLNLSKAVSSRDDKSIEAVLLEAGVLPHEGRHLKAVQDAKRLLDQIKEESRIKSMLEDAMATSDLSAIQSALKAAATAGLSKDPVVKRAEQTVVTIEKQKTTQRELQAAVEKRDTKLLTAAIKTAESLGMQKTPDYMDAVALKAKLEEESRTIAELEKAVKKKDVSSIKSLLVRMAELGLEDHRVTIEAQEVAKAEAKRSSEAQERMEHVQAQLEKAIETKDILALENLSRQAIEMGMKGPVIAEATRIRQQLLDKADLIANLTAEMKALDIRSKSHDGISKAEIKSLSTAIEAASEAGIGSSEEEMVEAMAFEERMHKQVAVQEEVKKAIQDGSEKALKAVIPKIQEIGLETGDAKKVIAEVRAKNASKSKAEREAAHKKRMENRKQLKEATEEEKLEDSLLRIEKAATSTAIKGRIAEASDNSLYDFTKFYQIRSDESFTEHVASDLKSQYAEFKLKCQGKPIPKSLLDLDDDLSRNAVQNHKAILQYCGELSNSFPTAMAGYVLVRGQENPDLVDEIFMQLIKHLTENKRPLSEERAWALMSMCCRTFPPSPEFEPFLFNFLLNHRKRGGLIGNFARLCLVLLNGTIELGPSCFLPDMDSVEAYSSRPPVLAEISKPDGSILSVPVAPDQDVGFVLEVCNQHLDISEDDQNLFAIFVIDGKQRSQMDLRTRLIRYYKKWNPSKLPYVDYFANNWANNEETLFMTLEKKYGAEPSPDEELDEFGDITSSQDRKGGKRSSRNFLRLPVTAARSVGKILGIRGENASAPAPSPETPWPLPWWSFLGDVYQRMIKQNREPIFSFKRMIIFGDESMDDQLFAQVQQEVRDGDLPVPDHQDLAKLVAIDLAIQNDGKKVTKIKGKSVQDAIVEVLPQAALKSKTLPDWETLVREAYNGEFPRTIPKLKSLYYEVCRRAPTFGMTYFYAQPHQSDIPVVLGVNVDGIHILNKVRTDILETFPFTKISRFGASGVYFWMQIVSSGGANTVYYRTVTPWSIYSTVYSVTQTIAARRGEE